MKVCLTIDIDMFDYVAGNEINEIKAAVLVYKSLNKLKVSKATWFVRIDEGIEMSYGSPTALLDKYPGFFRRMLKDGHEIAWHYHPGKKERRFTMNELKYYASIALRYGLKAARMGFGRQTNNAMRLLNELGFKIDSSAIPRPLYPWSRQSNWQYTPQVPFKPSLKDYRVPGKPCLDILEVPINTVPLGVKGDTTQMVRYINPAYRNAIFKKALQSAEGMDVLTLVNHPYEIMPNRPHPILAFNLDDFKQNVRYLKHKKHLFVTISELAKSS